MVRRTAVTPCEPDLLHVGVVLTITVERIKLVLVSRPLLHLPTTCLQLIPTLPGPDNGVRLRHLARLGPARRGIGNVLIKGWPEACTVLVQGQSMPKDADGFVRPRKRKCVRNNSNGSHGIPTKWVRRAVTTEFTEFVPDSDEIDVNVNGKRLLKRGRLLPALIIVSCEHLVCEVDLLVIARRQ